MLNSGLRKHFLEEVSFRKNYFYRLFWQILVWASWLLFSLGIFFLLLEKKTFWLGVFGLCLIIPQLRFLGKSRKKVPLDVESSRSEEIWDYLTPKTKRIISSAYLISQEKGKNFSFALLSLLLREKGIQKIFRELEVKKQEIKKEISFLEEEIKEKKEENDNNNLLETVVGLLKQALREADYYEDESLNPSHLFLALISKKDKLVLRFLLHLGLRDDQIREAVWSLKFRRKVSSLVGKNRISTLLHLRQKRIKHRIMNRAWTARATPFLDRYSYDLTDLARANWIGFMVDRKKEFDRMVDVLGRETQNNVLLVGEEGIGKKTMIEHLAWRIVNDQVPPKLFDKRMVELDLIKVIEGTRSEGEARERVNIILREILKAKNIILFLPRIENLFSHSELSVLASNFLPFFAESGFQVIATTTPEGERKMSPHRDFLETFDLIHLEEMEKSDVLKVLLAQATSLEKKYKIHIPLLTLEKVIELSKMFDPMSVLPLGGIRLLEEVIKEGLDRNLNVLEEDLVEEIVERKTGIPLKEASGLEAKELLNLEDLIHKRLIDQDEAVKAVARVLRSFRAGLKEKKGPIASFLFVGPTGVGKTQLAKILAKILFGKEEEIIRFDMSKYRDPLSIWKFIGSPQGEVGELSEAVLRHPYSLILLDEFEKATTEILNLFLPILDEGKIKDNLGRILDFSNSLIIATSNAGSEFIFQELEKGVPFEGVAKELRHLLVKDFPPELLNRFSEIIVFKPLSKEDVRKIAFLFLEPLVRELSEKYRYQLTITPAVVEKVINDGYSVQFGARFLKHTIDSQVRDFLAAQILANHWPEGTALELDFKNDRFSLKILNS